MVTKPLALRLAEAFELRGEDIYRRRNGKRVVFNADRYCYHNVCDGRGFSIGFHRLKFFLFHGWLPDMVDHRSGDISDNSLRNLRAASRPENMRNQPRVHLRRDLPRGVYATASGRYACKAWDGVRYHHFGTHDDPQVASALVEAFLRETHGEFYVAPT